MNEILEIVIQFKNLIQNIQRNFDKGISFPILHVKRS